MKSFFSRIRQTPQRSPELVPARKRPCLSRDPDLIYALGDVHGCLDALLRLERLIVEDARGRPGIKLIVMLGDYIDRGPNSSGVLDHFLEGPPEGFRRVCLCGNHDQALLRVLAHPETLHHWLDLGGSHTLSSYGIGPRELGEELRSGLREAVDLIRRAIPINHLKGLQRIPVSFTTPSYFFAHAGARPGIDLQEQREEDLMWIRQEFISAPKGSFDRLVVHGHTITQKPFADATRVAVDTGAYLGGPLTAARLDVDGIAFLSVPSR